MHIISMDGQCVKSYHIILSIIKNNDEDKTDYGFVFEVDIEYPEEVALKHEDIAFLLERKNKRY